MTKGTLLLLALTPVALLAEVSPYAPAQLIPASADGANVASIPAVASVSSSRPAPKGPRRAILPHERRRKESAIPGLVTYPFGKTASGERTHIYRIMGQGGVVADFLDYGARLYRLYVPDATGALVDVVADAKPSIIDYEKAGDLAAVWQMTPVRKPRATGLVFELAAEKETKATKATEATNVVSSVSSVASVSSSRVIYWIDAQNRLTIESTLAAEALWQATLPLAPLCGGRSLAIAGPTNTYMLAATTNVTPVALRPLTNATQKIEFLLK